MREKPNTILWIEAAGFFFMIVMSWLSELLRIPHYLFGDPFAPNWKRAILRTVVLSLIWLWVFLMTRRILQRMHHLEKFLRICSWCRKVGDDDEWLKLEDYFNSRFSTRTSHGMCPECLTKKREELALQNEPPAGPTK